MRLAIVNYLGSKVCTFLPDSLTWLLLNRDNNLGLECSLLLLRQLCKEFFKLGAEKPPQHHCSQAATLFWDLGLIPNGSQ